MNLLSKMSESLEQWLLSFKSGKTWLQNINSPETKRVYVSSIKKYCNGVNKNPDNLIAYKLEGLMSINTPKEWQAEELLENYLFEAKLTDSIKEQIKASVMSFYKNNKRQLNNQTAKNIGKPTPKQRTPSSEDLEKLESVMTCQRDRALIWFLASSGVRVGTLNKLTWQDLNPTQDSEVPYKMIIEAERLKGHGKGRYKGLKQICFIHGLAARKLGEYKIEAKAKGYNLGLQDPIFIRYSNEGKIQAMKNALMDKVFTVASLTLWHDLEKKRFSPHDIRDFTQSALESSGANSNVLSPLLAHKIRGVDKHYSSHLEAELFQVFKKALPWLMPTTKESIKQEAEQNKTETQVKLKNQQEQIINQEKQMKEQDVKIDELETKFEAKLAERVKMLIDFINEHGQDTPETKQGDELIERDGYDR